MSMVAERYAKALLDLAIANGAVEKYQEELEAVSLDVSGGKRSSCFSARSAEESDG